MSDSKTIWFRKKAAIRKVCEINYNLCSASLTTLKPLTVQTTTNCGKFLKRWEYQTISPVSWETCMQVKKQQLQSDMEQLTKWFKIGKGVWQGCILSPCLFNFCAEYIMGNTGLVESQAGIKIAGEISTTSDRQMISLQWQKLKRN